MQQILTWEGGGLTCGGGGLCELLHSVRPLRDGRQVGEGASHPLVQQAAAEGGAGLVHQVQQGAL